MSDQNDQEYQGTSNLSEQEQSMFDENTSQCIGQLNVTFQRDNNRVIYPRCVSGPINLYADMSSAMTFAPNNKTNKLNQGKFTCIDNQGNSFESSTMVNSTCTAPASNWTCFTSLDSCDNIMSCTLPDQSSVSLYAYPSEVGSTMSMYDCGNNTSNDWSVTNEFSQ